MNRIKELRKVEGLSQSELAKIVGATQRNISYWESGVEVNANYAVKLANYFDVSVDYLLGLKDDFGVKVKEQGKKPDTLSPDERKLVEGYRTINAAGKKLVMQTVETLKATATNKDKTTEEAG